MLKAVSRQKIVRLINIVSLLTISHWAWSEDRDAEKIFNDYCFSCHGTGWEDAPVLGDSFAWEDRRDKGMAALLKNTINGINAMPPKGTCNDCTEKELQSVIEYLIAE